MSRGGRSSTSWRVNLARRGATPQAPSLLELSAARAHPARAGVDATSATTRLAPTSEHCAEPLRHIHERATLAPYRSMRSRT